MELELNLMWAVLLLGLGLLLLWKSADWLVSGSVSFAERMGVSPIVIGLTIVAMGTSAPEVAASVASTLRGAGDVAIGNVYGSNIANLALIGGLCAMVSPVLVRSRLLKREVPAMLLSGILLWLVLSDLYLARSGSAILLGVFAAMIVVTVLVARHEKISEAEVEVPIVHKSMKMCVFMIMLGLAGLALGADMSLRGAVYIGRLAGLSEAVIGLTIVAIGTSLPELGTSVVASAKGHSDLSVGNLIGSNIFNTLLVTGTAGMVRPFGIASRLAGKDFWIMMGVSVLFTALALIYRRKIGRIGGVILLGVYAGYMVYLLASKS